MWGLSRIPGLGHPVPTVKTALKTGIIIWFSFVSWVNNMHSHSWLPTLCQLIQTWISGFFIYATILLLKVSVIYYEWRALTLTAGSSQNALMKFLSTNTESEYYFFYGIEPPWLSDDCHILEHVDASQWLWGAWIYKLFVVSTGWDQSFIDGRTPDVQGWLLAE